MNWNMGTLGVPPTWFSPSHSPVSLCTRERHPSPRLRHATHSHLRAPPSRCPHPALLPLTEAKQRGPIDSLPVPCPLDWFPPLWGSKGRHQPHPTPSQAVGTGALGNCEDSGARANPWAGGMREAGVWGRRETRPPPQLVEPSVAAGRAVRSSWARRVPARRMRCLLRRWLENRVLGSL